MAWVALFVGHHRFWHSADTSQSEVVQMKLTPATSTHRHQVVSARMPQARVLNRDGFGVRGAEARMFGSAGLPSSAAKSSVERRSAAVRSTGMQVQYEIETTPKPPMSPKGPPLWPASGPPFVSHMRALARSNRRQVRRLYVVPIDRCESLLNDHHAFAAEHVWTFDQTRPQPTSSEKLVFSAIGKNELALFAILEMTQAGLFGAVRPLLRQVFELQILAKFVSVTGESGLADRWADGHVPPIGRDVFPRLHPTTARPLRDFWNVLHPFVHASPSSQQVSPHVEHNDEEIGLDLMLLSFVLDAQCHVLLTHVFNSQSRILARRHAPRGRLPRLRRRIARQLAAQRAEFSAEGKSLVRAFRARWARQVAPRVV